MDIERAYELFRKLPDDLKREVVDYMEFLLKKKAMRKRKKLSLSWKGALKELRDEYTSVRLQHDVLKWWG